MLSRLGRWSKPALSVPVWASGIGLARTLLALGTAGTLAATDAAALMSPLSNGVMPPRCDGLNAIGVWCLVPGASPQIARWVGVAVLLVVASGWRPRFTAIPHWWIAWSLINNATALDGGDQITANLALLLIPICLTDSRRWHWQPPPAAPDEPTMRHVIARASLVLIQLQMAGLYLQASIAKLGVAEWADGTALYYWSQHPTFGSPPWLSPATDLLVYSPVGVAALTWGSMSLEFILGIAIFLTRGWKRWLLVAGLTFHAFIAVEMGLISFDLAMSGGLLLYLLPAGRQIVWPGRITAAGRTLVVYDGDCGFCARAVRFMQRRLRDPQAVQAVAWQSVPPAELGLTEQQVKDAAWVIPAGASPRGGAAAFAYLARLGGAAWPFAGVLLGLPPLSRLARRVYRLVARNRHRMSTFVSDGTCSMITASPQLRPDIK